MSSKKKKKGKVEPISRKSRGAKGSPEKNPEELEIIEEVTEIDSDGAETTISPAQRAAEIVAEVVGQLEPEKKSDSTCIGTDEKLSSDDTEGDKDASEQDGESASDDTKEDADSSVEDARDTILKAFSSTAGVTGALKPVVPNQTEPKSKNAQIKTIVIALAVAVLIAATAYFVNDHLSSEREREQQAAMERRQQAILAEAQGVGGLYVDLQGLVQEHSDLLVAINNKQEENAEALEAWEKAWQDSLDEYDRVVNAFHQEVDAVRAHNERERQRERDSRVEVTNIFGRVVSWEYTYTARLRNEPTNFPEWPAMPPVVSVDLSEEIGEATALAERINLMQRDIEGSNFAEFAEAQSLMADVIEALESSTSNISSTLNDSALMSSAFFDYPEGGRENKGTEIDRGMINTLSAISVQEFMDRFSIQLNEFLYTHDIPLEEVGIITIEESGEDDAEEEGAEPEEE